MFSDIKKDLANKTLVGEYIGNPEMQHMVRYTKTTNIFYAIVDNYSSEICYPCEQTV